MRKYLMLLIVFLEKAIEKYEEAARLWTSVNEPVEAAEALNSLGYSFRLLSNYPKALSYYSQALSLRRAANDTPGQAQTLTNIGAIHYFLGENQKALDYNDAPGLRQTENNRQEEAPVAR